MHARMFAHTLAHTPTHGYTPACSSHALAARRCMTTGPGLHASTHACMRPHTAGGATTVLARPSSPQVMVEGLGAHASMHACAHTGAYAYAHQGRSYRGPLVRMRHCPGMCSSPVKPSLHICTARLLPIRVHWRSCVHACVPIHWHRAHEIAHCARAQSSSRTHAFTHVHVKRLMLRGCRIIRVSRDVPPSSPHLPSCLHWCPRVHAHT